MAKVGLGVIDFEGGAKPLAEGRLAKVEGAITLCSLDSEGTLGEHGESKNGFTHPDIGDAAFSATSALVSSAGPKGASVS